MAGTFIADPRGELSKRLLRAVEAGEESGRQNKPLNVRSAPLWAHENEC